MTDLPDAIRVASERRRTLHDDPDQTAYRLFHGYGEGYPGVTVDRYGDVALLSHKVEVAPAMRDAAARALLERAPVQRVIAKQYHAVDQGVRPVSVTQLYGEPITESVEVRDHGLRFMTRLHTPESNGLFLDARPARAWIREHASGRRILNLFAYTGSLGVAAAAGGARSVVHVDNKKNPLEIARQNHVLNGLPIDDRSLLCGNVYAHLPRARKAGRLLDGIILDPPPQVPANTGRRRPEGQDYGQLSSLAAPVLASEGWLLCFFNRLDRTRQEMEAEVLESAGVPLEVLWRGESGEDFPEVDQERKLRLTAFRRL
ncbi:MAG: hypothetical protein HN712_04720 [Gemmatimonadetes bacterium]|jgi:23S rRNA (cytosine1962-C5)-methyltransferase|nr:hypothetical protein [Gemmatimonadota bacterium]MBT6147446.1 hypothetical protein [Gemmatimonadota bacterium]MBT7859589.1 hypothetical protein [Gemmatimonadota bacterium]